MMMAMTIGAAGTVFPFNNSLIVDTALEPGNQVALGNPLLQV